MSNLISLGYKCVSLLGEPDVSKLHVDLLVVQFVHLRNVFPLPFDDLLDAVLVTPSETSIMLRCLLFQRRISSLLNLLLLSFFDADRYVGRSDPRGGFVFRLVRTAAWIVLL